MPIPGSRSRGQTSLCLVLPSACPKPPRVCAARGELGSPAWGKGTRRSASVHPVLPHPHPTPGQLRAAGRTHLPVFCRDRRPFCWEPLSWGPSGGFVESVPRAGSKVANTKARVTNWPSRSAHMVLGITLPPGDLDSLCAPPPPLPPPRLPPLPLFLLAGPFPPPRRGSDRGYPAPSRSSPESM